MVWVGRGQWGIMLGRRCVRDRRRRAARGRDGLSRPREKGLNDAITSADPSAGFEPFACAYSEFYHSDAQVKIENRELQGQDRKSTRLNSSHQIISYAVFCLKKKKKTTNHDDTDLE